MSEAKARPLHLAQQLGLSKGASSKWAEETHMLPARMVVRRVTHVEKNKGAWLAITLFIFYTSYNVYRFDSSYASSTLSIYEDAQSKLPGIAATQSAYCQLQNDGTYIDSHTNDTCLVKYDDIIQLSDLQNFIHQSILTLPSAISGVCKHCGLAITSSSRSFVELSEADFMCTDFEVRSSAGCPVAEKLHRLPSCWRARGPVGWLQPPRDASPLLLPRACVPSIAVCARRSANLARAWAQ